MEVPQRLTQLEKDLTLLLRQYDQYLNGGEQMEPLTLLGKVEREVLALSHLPTMNTSQRFRLNTLTSRFYTNRNRWRKILRDREAKAADEPQA
ncbi:MAG: hypothetical protein HYT87_17690 [Nitrospirae bacterium]|nr:hypothetical protein [Nitrospirota bacterium]